MYFLFVFLSNLEIVHLPHKAININLQVLLDLLVS